MVYVCSSVRRHFGGKFGICETWKAAGRGAGGVGRSKQEDSSTRGVGQAYSSQAAASRALRSAGRCGIRRWDRVRSVSSRLEVCPGFSGRRCGAPERLGLLLCSRSSSCSGGQLLLSGSLPALKLGVFTADFGAEQIPDPSCWKTDSHFTSIQSRAAASLSAAPRPEEPLRRGSAARRVESSPELPSPPRILSFLRGSVPVQDRFGSGVFLGRVRKFARCGTWCRRGGIFIGFSWILRGKQLETCSVREVCVWF